MKPLPQPYGRGITPEVLKIPIFTVSGLLRRHFRSNPGVQGRGLIPGLPPRGYPRQFVACYNYPYDKEITQYKVLALTTQVTQMHSDYSGGNSVVYVRTPPIYPSSVEPLRIQKSLRHTAPKDSYDLGCGRRTGRHAARHVA